MKGYVIVHYGIVAQDNILCVTCCIVVQFIASYYACAAAKGVGTDASAVAAGTAIPPPPSPGQDWQEQESWADSVLFEHLGMIATTKLTIP